jgi:hypothetical protein
VAASPRQLDPELTISFLRGDTADPACTELADQLHAKFMTPGPRASWHGAYQDGASILVLPSTFDEYWNGPAGYGTRRKVRRALKEGYTFGPVDRDRYVDDIYAINTSMSERQGRPMKDPYLQRPGPYGPLPSYPCPRHQLRTYGVFHEGHLVAYTWLYQVGEMCLFSTILGHGDHLNAGVMYLLVAETLRDIIDAAGTRYAMYNMHSSGTEGLRFFKEQMGFRPFWVNWQLADEPVARPHEPLLESAAVRRLRRWAHPLPLARRIARRLGVAGLARRLVHRLGLGRG